jgi:serine/threonine-protein kinase
LTVVRVDEQGDSDGDGSSHKTTSESYNAQAEALQERYDIKARLGTGGTAVVVKAEATVLDRTVAINILSKDLAEYEASREISTKESRSLATLSHPHLVSVFDVVENARRPLMITEYVNGLTVEKLIQSDQVIPQSSVLRIAVQLSRAVEYLHSEGVVHRDIKPGNIMLTEEGQLKIIDFGLARSLQYLADKTTRVRGTPAYMAPEQNCPD